METKQATIDEIKAITARLAEVQRSRELSDTKLVDEYPDIGSTKTWRQRLVEGRFDGLNLDRTLHRLRRVATILDGGTPDETFYADMPFVREMNARLARLERQESDRRILACLAANGTGKSIHARWAVAQSRSRRAYVRLRPSWRNKILHISSGIALALGMEIDTTSPKVAEGAAIDALRSHPRTLFIDQAHEGGVAVMHLLRVFVDETPSRFVYMAYDTAYRWVLASRTDAGIEAKAFLGRCLKPVYELYKSGTRLEDARCYLQHAGFTASVAGSVAQRIVTVLQCHTNLRLLDDAICAARGESADDEASPEQVVKQVYRLAGVEQRPTAEIEEAA